MPYNYYNNYYGAARGAKHNPFLTYSNHVYPRTIHDALIWAMWFWDRNPKYRMAIQKVVSYFIAGIKVIPTKDQVEVDTDSLDVFKERLENVYNLSDAIMQFGLEVAALGNSFVSCEPIFSRLLLCPRKDCGWQMTINKCRKGREYEWDGHNFKGVCPQCHHRVTYIVEDVKSQGPQGEKVRFVFRNAQDMDIQYNELTGNYRYLYKLPNHIKDAIKRGDQVYLESTPRAFLDAAYTDSYIEFPSAYFFHARTSTLSAFDKMFHGWGLPLFMNTFDNFVRMQHLDKFNEAVTMDYIAPIRVLSPDPANLKAGVDDPNRMPMSGYQFQSFMTQSVKRVKENPTTWIVSPVPVNYQMLGGEWKQLAPVDLLEWTDTDTLSGMGIPQEFKQTTFQVVAPSMGLRMFERQWTPFHKNMNRFTAWAGQCICDAENMENMSVELDTTSFVEDDMNKQVRLQLMQGGVISKTDTLKTFGIDFTDDLKLRIQEKKKEDEENLQAQKDQQGAEMVSSVIPPPGSIGVGQAQAAIDAMQQQAQGGDPAAAGAPMPPAQPAGPAMGGMPAMPFNTGSSESATIGTLWQQAADIANQLYAVDPLTRRRELENLKATNEPLHAQVVQLIEDMKSDVASQAVQQSQQPQQ